MDKAILLGLLLIIFSFVLAFTNTLPVVAIASFPIGALIIVIRIMQLLKFQFRRGALFALFLVGLGIAFFILGNPSSHNILYFKILFNNDYARIIALASILMGILILTAKTAIWGSKYLSKSGSCN